MVYKWVATVWGLLWGADLCVMENCPETCGEISDAFIIQVDPLFQPYTYFVMILIKYTF